jgi:hypothetical protein
MHASLYYLPPFVGLAALGVYHAVTVRGGRFDLLIAAGVLTVSLAFRTIDDAVCAAFPDGTISCGTC